MIYNPCSMTARAEACSVKARIWSSKENLHRSGKTGEHDVGSAKYLALGNRGPHSRTWVMTYQNGLEERIHNCACDPSQSDAVN